MQKKKELKRYIKEFQYYLDKSIKCLHKFSEMLDVLLEEEGASKEEAIISEQEDSENDMHVIRYKEPTRH